jgi:hypothetical protein
METLEDYQPYLLSCIGISTLVLFYLLFRKDPEAAIPYNVTPPEQSKPGWKGQVLEEPALKVRMHHW